MREMLLLRSGGLRKESVISAQRKGQYTIACDSYAGASAIQVVDEYEVFDMLNDEELERIIKKHRPDIITLEVGATRTECLYDFKKEGIQVVSSAHTANCTMNHKATRDLVAKGLGLRTAKYYYVKSLEEPEEAAAKIGSPCVVKPLMPPSGKGQSLARSTAELEYAWEYGCSGSRGDTRKLIIEEFIKFGSEITLLMVTQKSGPTLFYPPIGHVQKGGDHRESFQPAHIDPAYLKEAEEMAEKVTRALTGAGLWGVEFFLSHENGVYFSELPPRPYDTGMVTLMGTQNLNEFELHLCTVLGLPILGIKRERAGASAVILSPIASQERPQHRGMEEVIIEEDTYLRIFSKPYTCVNRRMGVIFCYVPNGSDLDALRDKTKRIADKVEVY